MLHQADSATKSSGGRDHKSLVVGTSASQLSVDTLALPTPDGSDNGIENRFEMDDEGAKMLLNTLPIHVSYRHLF